MNAKKRNFKFNPREIVSKNTTHIFDMILSSAVRLKADFSDSSCTPHVAGEGEGLWRRKVGL